MKKIIIALGILALMPSVGSAITINISSALSIQDEGLTNVDVTDRVSTLDGIYAPEGVNGMVDYYRNGPGNMYFDALSLSFDLSGVGYETIETASLRFYAQKGSFNSTWEHYLLLEGANNTAYQDDGPFYNAAVVDFGGAGSLSPNTTVGWLTASITPTWITDNSLDLTLRLWNARIDRVELVVTATTPAQAVPEPGTLLLLGSGLLGLCVLQRRKRTL